MNNVNALRAVDEVQLPDNIHLKNKYYGRLIFFIKNAVKIEKL